MKKISFVFAAAALLAALPASAAEEKDGGEFGNAGVINIGAATSLALEFGSSKSPDPPVGTGKKTSSTVFSITPSIDYFVIDNLSVGALVLFRTESRKPEDASDSDSSTTWGVGPRVGYNLWLTPGQLSLWPTLALLYSSTSTKAKGQDGPSFSTMSLDLFVPLLVHPVKHFHFAIGPFASFDLSSKAKPPNGDSVDSDKSTTFGLRGEIAGWL
ncbi:MAG: hypothetical protein ACXVEF_43970 [Polyangiales bacterium]